MRRLLAALVVFAWPAAAASPVAASIEGACVATLNGIAIDRIDGLASPLELDAGDTLVFEGTAEGGTTAARLSLVAGPVEIDSASTQYATPTTAFSATIDLDELTAYAVGLYRVRGEVDGCSVEAWLRITGRFPLTTLAGLTGAGLMVAGFAGQLGAIASRRRFTATGAALAGVLTGTGAAVIAQQFGRLQPSYLALAGCVIAASSIGFGLARLVGRAARDRRHAKRRISAESATRPAPEPTAEPVLARTTPAAAEPPRHEPVVEAPEAAPMPYWGYVLSDVDVLDIADHTRVVGTLRPGVWYLIKREVGAWVHISATPGPEGWAARHAINRQG